MLSQVFAYTSHDTPQYGSGKTLGARAGGGNPTYVYPAALKAVVRARYPAEVQDWLDPVGPQVTKTL